MEYEKTESIDGTSGQGTIEVSFKEIFDKLGPCHWDGEGYKIDAEWAIKSGDTIKTDLPEQISFIDIIKENNIDYIDFLKLDCEGCEHELLLNIIENNLDKKIFKIKEDGNLDNFLTVIVCFIIIGIIYLIFDSGLLF
mgnify:CR=1 FL=1